MKDEKETKAKLLESAKAEFMEKGYQGASLRNICRNAGVTTGALYFFFQDKEELFASLVQPVVQLIQAMMEEHMRLELIEAEADLQEEQAKDENEMKDDIYASAQIVHILYENYDSVQLLLMKSQGSKMAGCVDTFVDMAEQNYRKLAETLAAKCGIPSPDDYTIHWVAHMQIDAFVHLLTHETDEKRALEHLKDVLRYLVAGWYALFDRNHTSAKKILEMQEK